MTDKYRKAEIYRAWRVNRTEPQTLEQLRAERDHWIKMEKSALGFASAKAADDFRQGCEAWIKRREAEQQTAA